MVRAKLASLMAVNLGDHISGVFWAAFLLFSWTAASIVSGAVIERITTFAFGILAICYWISFLDNRCCMGMALSTDGCLNYLDIMMLTLQV